MQVMAGGGEAMGEDTGPGDAVRIRGGEAGMEEHDDTGDDTTSISMASSASPSPSVWTPYSAAALTPQPAMELQCAN